MNFMQFWSLFKYRFRLAKDGLKGKTLRREHATMLSRLNDNLGIGRASVDFFGKNSERVEKVASLLFDEESKDTYLKIIKYRQTFDFQDFPAYNKGGYFRNSFFTYDCKEVLIDCGAYNGDTIREFLSMATGYEKIVAFEPDPESFKTLTESERWGSIVFINAGVYDKDCNLYFSGGNSGGLVSEKSNGIYGEISVKVCSIDGLHLPEKVTFIKMDIEGSEMNALIGAKKTILRDRPKLAICIYHSNEDMVRIAEYIHEIVPEYKLYVRHNGRYPFAWETVLYATML